MKASDKTITEIGERGSGDLEAEAFSHGVELTIDSSEDAVSYVALDFHAALRLGTWLIAHAIAGGARPPEKP